MPRQGADGVFADHRLPAPPTLPLYDIQHVCDLDDPGVPELPEAMQILVASHDVLGASFHGAFENPIIIRVLLDDVHALGRYNEASNCFQ